MMIDEVGELIRRAARTAVLPRFRRLAEGDIAEKAPGEVVTVADRESEEILAAGLVGLLPGSVVVGEEASADDPAVLHRLAGDGAVWLVDPLDGTKNFAAGREPFAVMVTLLRAGDPVAAWILDVVADRLATAEAGAGAFVDGIRVRTRADLPPRAALRGAVMTRFLPYELRTLVEAGAGQLGEVSAGRHCAGHEYPAVVADDQQFALFWRTLPWDHAAGALFIREAGGVACRFDGSRYRPTDGRTGLLVAANAAIWSEVQRTLLPGTADAFDPAGAG